MFISPLWETLKHMSHLQGFVKPHLAIDRVAASLFDKLVKLQDILTSSSSCASYEICQNILQTLDDLGFEDAVVMGLEKHNEIPFLKISGCNSLFLHCSGR